MLLGSASIEALWDAILMTYDPGDEPSNEPPSGLPPDSPLASIADNADALVDAATAHEKPDGPGQDTQNQRPDNKASTGDGYRVDDLGRELPSAFIYGPSEYTIGDLQYKTRPYWVDSKIPQDQHELVFAFETVCAVLKKMYAPVSSAQFVTHLISFSAKTVWQAMSA